MPEPEGLQWRDRTGLEKDRRGLRTGLSPLSPWPPRSFARGRPACLRPVARSFPPNAAPPAQSLLAENLISRQLQANTGLSYLGIVSELLILCDNRFRRVVAPVADAASVKFDLEGYIPALCDEGCVPPARGAQCAAAYRAVCAAMTRQASWSSRVFGKETDSWQLSLDSDVLMHVITQIYRPPLRRVRQGCASAIAWQTDESLCVLRDPANRQACDRVTVRPSALMTTQPTTPTHTGYGRTRLLECQKCIGRGTNGAFYALIALVNVFSLSLTVRSAILRAATSGHRVRPPIYSQIIKVRAAAKLVRYLRAITGDVVAMCGMHGQISVR